MENKVRNSSIIVLIFSMFLIISHHALYYGCAESLAFFNF